MPSRAPRRARQDDQIASSGFESDASELAALHQTREGCNPRGTSSCKRGREVLCRRESSQSPGPLVDDHLLRKLLPSFPPSAFSSLRTASSGACGLSRPRLFGAAAVINDVARRSITLRCCNESAPSQASLPTRVSTPARSRLVKTGPKHQPMPPIY